MGLLCSFFSPRLKAGGKAASLLLWIGKMALTHTYLKPSTLIFFRNFFQTNHYEKAFGMLLKEYN
jgi:hypothetical protein